MCDYGWDGYNAGDAKRPLRTPIDHAAVSRAARAVLKGHVSKRISALKAVDQAAKEHPELHKRDLRAAIWELVGSGELDLNLDGTIQPGARTAR